MGIKYYEMIIYFREERGLENPAGKIREERGFENLVGKMIFRSNGKLELVLQNMGVDFKRLVEVREISKSRYEEIERACP